MEVTRMEARNDRRIPRTASALAVSAGIVNVVIHAAVATELSRPEALLAVVGALAPTLAILVAWWVPSRIIAVAMLSVAMLLELPALVSVGSLLALAVEVLLVVAVLATYVEPETQPAKPRALSIVW